MQNGAQVMVVRYAQNDARICKCMFIGIICAYASGRQINENSPNILCGTFVPTLMLMYDRIDELQAQSHKLPNRLVNVLSMVHDQP